MGSLPSPRNAAAVSATGRRRGRTLPGPCRPRQAPAPPPGKKLRLCALPCGATDPAARQRQSAGCRVAGRRVSPRRRPRSRCAFKLLQGDSLNLKFKLAAKPPRLRGPGSLPRRPARWPAAEAATVRPPRPPPARANAASSVPCWPSQLAELAPQWPRPERLGLGVRHGMAAHSKS